MPRKSLSRIAVDVGAYVTGHSEIPALVPPGDFPYPIDWRFTLEDIETYFAPFDENGLPMKVFGGSTDAHYLPSRMATWALAHWSKYEDAGEEVNREAFLRSAEWFADQENGLYHHHYDMPAIGTEGPWLSALSQGQAISVLTRANAVTGEHDFLRAADRAAVPLVTPCDDGGVVNSIAGAGPFLEEYPDRGSTLNGCLLAIVGLEDLVEAGAGESIVGYPGQVIATVADQVEAWERNGWSLYNRAPVGSDVVPNFNTVRYHSIHVRLLDHFANRTGDERLIAAADRTRVAMGRLGVRLWALTRKTGYRLRAGW